MAHIDEFKSWAETIRGDIEAFKALLESATADARSRELAGGALQYLVSKMDLIPDWNEGIGVIDDVMILRVAAKLAQDHAKGELPGSAEAALERLTNESESIDKFLGGPVSDRLRAYTAKLGETKVRNRTPAQLIEDPALRAVLYKELEEELAKNVPIVISDPADAELRLKAYLTHKLS